MPPSDDLQIAQHAALAGARVGLTYFSRVGDLIPEQKADGSLVTEADRVVEQTIKDVIAAARPTDAFLGEETGESGHSPRRGILDGVDGTSVFVKRDNRWQSLVALEIDHRVTVGVCIVPAQGTIWYAARGQGAFVARLSDNAITHAQRLDVATTNHQTRQHRIVVLPPLVSLPTHFRLQAERILAGTEETPWSAHAALLVANGEFDLAVQFGGYLWDYAALSLIVEEAGGIAVDDHGRPYPVTGIAVFARTRELLTRIRDSSAGIQNDR